MSRRSRRIGDRCKREGEVVKRTRLKVFSAGLVGLALVAAACGGDDSGGSGGRGSGNTVDPGGKAGVQAALGGGTATTAAGGATATTAAQPQPTSIDDWEAL